MARDSVTFANGFAEGYHGSNYVLFDDWDPQALSPERWNQLLDNYKTIINIKGSVASWKARFLAITRTHNPVELTEYEDMGARMWTIMLQERIRDGAAAQ